MPTLTDPISTRDHPEELQDFLDKVINGKLDADLLREKAPVLMSFYGKEYKEYFQRITGQCILQCSLCSRVAYAALSVSAYNGAHDVCDVCVKMYSFCKKCNSYILTNDLDNPSHEHISSTPQEDGFWAFDGEVQVYNADIMAGKPHFYKTDQEHQIWKHQKESHVDILHKAHTEIPFRYFGVEIEVEKIPGAPPDMILRTYKQFPDGFVMVKHDGSLSDKGKGGFEIVTCPGTLAYHKGGVWDKFFDNLGGFFLETAPTAGIHIHAGLGTITKIVSGKMLMFINAQRNREFIESIAERTLGLSNPNGKVYMNVNVDWKMSDIVRTKQHENSCCWHPKNRLAFNRYVLNEGGSVKKDSFGNPIIASIKPGSLAVRPVCKCLPGVYNLTKYEAFNLMTHRPTVELRIFRGIVHKEFLYSALEFTDALADYCSEVSPAQLNYTDFLAWMTHYNASGKTKLYPNLSRHLINKGWLDPKKSALKPGVPDRASLKDSVK